MTSPTACGALFSARTTPQPSQNLAEPSRNPGKTFPQGLPGPPRSLSGAETPKLSAVGENPPKKTMKTKPKKTRRNKKQNKKNEETKNKTTKPKKKKKEEKTCSKDREETSLPIVKTHPDAWASQLVWLKMKRAEGRQTAGFGSPRSSTSRSGKPCWKIPDFWYASAEDFSDSADWPESGLNFFPGSAQIRGLGCRNFTEGSKRRVPGHTKQSPNRNFLAHGAPPISWLKYVDISEYCTNITYWLSMLTHCFSLYSMSCLL